MNILLWFGGVILFFFAVAILFMPGWDVPPIDSVQSGYRGTGILQVYNPRTLSADAVNHEVPEPLPPSAGGPAASMIYQNVEVLGDLSLLEFNRLMQAMTNWVSPEEGCAYCHNEANYASDEVYTKIVSRKMLQMTQEINSAWQGHVANTGVTCYTCHRGNPVPEHYWFRGGPETEMLSEMLGDRAGQNIASSQAVLSSLPQDAFTPFLEDDREIRVIGDTALPTGNRRSIKQTEWTYSLMMHMSDSLGVNCTFCHNSRNFADWSQSSPQRVTSWYGINMVQAINTDWIVPLDDVFPAHRKGPQGDVFKANCATCHQGAYKPLYGVSMLPDYPNLADHTSAEYSQATEEASAESDDVVALAND